MELVIALAGALILAVPIIAIVALVRTVSLRADLDLRYLEQQDKIQALESQVSSLRRGLAQAADRLHEPVVAQPVASTQPVPEAPGPKSAPVVQETPRIPDPVRVWPSQDLPKATPPAPPKTTPVAPPIAARVEAAPQTAPFGATHRGLIPAAPAPPTPADAPAIPPVTQATPQQTQSVASGNRLFAGVGTPDAVASGPSQKTFAERLRMALPFEEVLGMNLFAKIGIVLLVLGFALLGRVALVAMSAGERDILILAVAGAMLGGGIWLERKERYRMVGRTGIGGGWALLFFIAYAANHVHAMAVIGSNALDCVLMLAVAIAMVAHTLRYRSQLVTGLAFLLAFSTVAQSQDTVYSLVAGIILAIGIVVIALRMSWFELEVFGILASYANHFYWLYKLYPDGVAGHAFPEFWPGALILILYWAVFRISYVARTIRVSRDETISTVAALANTFLLLGVMKFQSTRPELAFYALAALGTAEFIFGQLPPARRRRPAFILLTVLGTILVFASVPFKFSGNNIAFLWMIVAEVLLIAGFVQREVVFRRLGWLGGAITGTLILYEAKGIINLRQTSQAPLVHSGVLLLACSLFFYVNALYLRAKWNESFDHLDKPLAVVQSYLGALTALLGIWALFPGDKTAVGWATIALACAFGKRFLKDDHLLLQSGALGVGVVVQAFIQNCHFADPYPHHVLGRLITLPLLALIFYFVAWTVSGLGEDSRNPVRVLGLWAGTGLLATLAWLDMSQPWVAAAWIVLAVALSLIARRLQIADLCYQEHVLAVATTVQLLAVNITAQRAIDRYIPLIACACTFYAISRFCSLKDALYGRPAAWAHTWVATGLLAALAWHEAPQLWLTAIWAVFALALAFADRIFVIEELPYQGQMLALLVVTRAITLNMFTLDKWHSVDVRLITVSILVAALYALAHWVRLPASLQDTEARHVYTWVASSLAAWLLWSELQPISVALGLAVFGLLLFEWADWRQIRQIRLQAYVALTAAFVRIFFVNLTAATLPGEMISPRIYTVAPLALIYFFIWAQSQTRKGESGVGGQRFVTHLIAYFGTGCVTALLYFEVRAEWVVLAWAVTVLALMASTLLLNKEVFLYQAELLTAGIVARGLAHNTYGGSYFTDGGWHGNLVVLSATSAILLLALSIAFRLRTRYGNHFAQSRLSRKLGMHRPEQILFFAPVILVLFMIAVKMNPGMVTLSWGVEGLMVILLGLVASQRSYRITGLLLLLLCVAKIVFRDAWHLGERDRYITFIVLGAALTLVSALYGRYRETVRRLL